MASSYFCPEEHRPLAVISESYRDEVKGRLPELPAWERYSLGHLYESRLFSLLHQYLELSTTDTLCYVGDTRDHLIDRLTDHFCLIHPVQTVHPGTVHYQETADHKVLPLNISHCGAEEFFRDMVRQHQTDRGNRPVKFTKILVHDGCRYLSRPREFYANVLQCLAPGGILLVLHRPGPLSTLPFFREAHSRLAEHDIPHMSIVQDLYSLPEVDVTWQLESLPVLTRKRKWLAMVRDRYPYNMQLMSGTEVEGGLRELSEGIFKYEGDQVEFDDCLLFVRVTRKAEAYHQSSASASISQERTKIHHHTTTTTTRSTTANPLRTSSQDHIHHYSTTMNNPQRNNSLKLSMVLPAAARRPPASSVGAPRADQQTSFKFLWD